MWQKYNWPPSGKIIPLFVGFHYQSFRELNYWNCVADEKFISDGIGRRYLETYSPVGCRDMQTLRLMQRYSIPSYFSGCITLTFNGEDYVDEKLKNTRYVVLCDIGNEVAEKVKKILENTDIEIKTVTHNVKNTNKEFSWEERKKYAENILTLYKNALCVITFRLHAALPCLALKTPVLLVRKSLDNTRFVPYDSWLNYALEKDFLEGKVNYDITNPPKNNDTYLEYKLKMEKDINTFLYEVENGCKKPFDNFFDSKEVNEWRVQKLRVTCEEYRKELERKVHEINILKK